MSKKNCLIKLSGDTLTDQVLNWVGDLSRQYHVVICVGGGTQINEAFAKAGLPLREFGPLGRDTVTLQEKQLARDVLEKNRSDLQDRLASLGVSATVVIPVLEIDSIICHVNGDQFILAAYHGFDVLYIVTVHDRVQTKKQLFAPYEKIRVVGF